MDEQRALPQTPFNFPTRDLAAVIRALGPDLAVDLHSDEQPPEFPREFALGPGFASERDPAETWLEPLDDAENYLEPLQPAGSQLGSPEGAPELSQGQAPGLVERARQVLSPLLGPTARQQMSEMVPVDDGFAYKPGGSRADQLGLVGALFSKKEALPSWQITPETGGLEGAAAALYNAGLKPLAEALLSPGGVATLGGGALVPGLGRVAAGSFAGMGALQAPDVYANTKLTLTDPNTPVPEAMQAAGELLASLALPTVGLRYAVGTPNPPINPTVLPPLANPRVPAPRPTLPGQDFIDVTPAPLPGPTVAAPYPTPKYYRPAEWPDYPVGRADYVVTPSGQAINVGQLTAAEQRALMNTPRTYVPREQVVRPSQGEIPIIGPIKQIVIEEGGIPKTAQPLVAANVPNKPPVEPAGGKISFAAEAEAKGVPNARQSAPDPTKGARGRLYNNPFDPELIRQALVTANQELAPAARAVGEVVKEGAPAVAPLAAIKPASAQWQVTVQSPQGEVPGYVQIDDVTGGRNAWSKSPETLAKEGTVVPDFSRLPQGRYTWEQAVELAQPKAEPPVSQRLSTFGPLDPELYTEALKGTGRAVAGVTRAYAEPLREALGRAGGPVSKRVSEEIGQMTADEKQLMGELAPTLDPAKLATNKPNPANLWLRRLNNVTEHTAFNNSFGVNEGDFPAAPVARRAYNAVDLSNWDIGRLAMRASPGFVPSGKFQRILTPTAVDFIREGGVAAQRWAEGLAARNGKSPQGVLKMMSDMKAALDSAKDDGGARFERISQDFVRQFPKTITHVRHGGMWHEVVVADPFRYLEAAARKTARAVAFRRVYPLVRDPMTGKWVSSGLFEDTRKAVHRELPTNRERTTFDDVFSTLAGHTLDPFNRGWNRASAAVDVVQAPLKALQLTLNAPVNLAELVFGGPAIFFRVNRLLPAMARLGPALYQQLEQVGAVDKAIQNFSFDPTSPVRSTSRIAANTVRKWTGQQIVNELQETQAAAVAQYVADAVKAGKIKGQELTELEITLRAMGFTRAQAARGIAGDSEVLRQFVTRAAPFLTAGNMLPVEMSRLGVARWFNFWFPYHRYSMMAMNQLRKVTANLYDDLVAMKQNPSRANWNRIRAGAKLLSKQIAFRGLQGFFTKAILAIAGTWLYGLTQQREETKDAPVKVVVDSLAAGYGGPLAIIKKVAGETSDAKGLVIGAAQTSGTFNWMSELLEMGLNSGAYAGKSLDEKLVTFLQKQTPGSRIVHTVVAVSGLAEANQELDAAMIAFRRWRKEQPGYAPRTSAGGEADEKSVREQIRKVVVAIEQGKDWHVELEKLTDYKHAASALRAKSLLNIDGSPLTVEQMKSLEGRIGKKAVAKIQTRDAMLHEIARYITEARSTKGIAEPTGRFAEDLERESTRTERIRSKLEPAVAELFKSAELDPSLEAKGYGKTGKVDRSLTVKQAGKVEEDFVRMLNRTFSSATTNENFLKTWRVSSREQKAAFLKKQVESARKAARYSASKPAN